MWLIAYFIFLQLKSLKLWEHRNTRNVFYQQTREILTSIIRGQEKEILIHGGREKLIWAGDHRKVNGIGSRDQGLGAKKINTRPFSNIFYSNVLKMDLKILIS